MDLETPAEDRRKGPNSRGHREGAGLGQVEHSGGGADKREGLTRPDEVQDLRDPVRRRAARGRGRRGGATAALATHRLVRSPPTTGPNPRSIPWIPQA